MLIFVCLGRVEFGSEVSHCPVLKTRHTHPLGSTGGAAGTSHVERICTRRLLCCFGARVLCARPALWELPLLLSHSWRGDLPFDLLLSESVASRTEKGGRPFGIFRASFCLTSRFSILLQSALQSWAMPFLAPLLEGSLVQNTRRSLAVKAAKSCAPQESRSWKR